MIRQWFNFKCTRLFPVRMMKLITCISLLLYVVSCGSSDDSTSSPSPSPSPLDTSPLDPIRSLTLDGVDESSITIDWDLLKTEEGAVNPAIVYTVYAESHAGEGVFTAIPDTETIYTLFSADLGGGKMSTELPVDGTGNRAVGVQVTNLANHTPYQIVVMANDASGNSTNARLLAYTASALTDLVITNMEATSIPDSEEVTVTWDPKEGAHAYAIQATDGGNQFGGNVPTDNVITVVCAPDFLLLCENSDQFAQEDNNKLRYTFTVNHRGGRYKLAIIPFNFQDLAGLQAVDEAGVAKPFIEGVLAQVEDEKTAVGERLKNTIQDPDKVKEVQLQVSEAGAPIDLVLDSTGSTLSASWGHGIGAEYYYAILTGEGVVITNIIDRYEPSGRFTGGGYVGFGHLTTNTVYTVTVQSFMVSGIITNLGGEVSATLSTKDASDILYAPERIAGENLILTDEAGKLRVTWNTAESNSVIGYNIFYWLGDTPSKPQYVARKGESSFSFTVPPGNYHVKVDVLSTYPGKEVVTGDTNSIAIYGQPLAPKDLGIAFNRGSFTNIGNRLYAIGYPLTYTEAKTPAEAGGPVGDVSYHYRYRVEGGEWVGSSEVTGEAMISLQVEDLSDADVVKAGYGEKYQVEVIASNAGGFVSDAGTLEFTYKSFPEPFNQKDNLMVETKDRSLTVTWPEVSEVNGSTIANYTVVLSINPYAAPVQSVTVVEREVVFEELINNQPYFITVIPNGSVTGNILTALSVVTGYTIGEAIGQGSPEERILATYTGFPDTYTPQGSPGMVAGLAVTAGDDLATVTWGEAAGSPATKYVLEYLSNVAAVITNINVVGDVADTELSGLPWEGATSVEVTTNDTGGYSHQVDGLDVKFATNVFRVRAVRVDDSGQEWLGEYRYYALEFHLSRAPSSVGKLTFSDHEEDPSLGGVFTVSWSKPTNAGLDQDGTNAQLVGYKVSWGTTAEVDAGSNEITNIDTLTYRITRLTPGTQYYVKVQAKNDNTERDIYHAGSLGTTYTVKTPGEVVTSTIVYSEHTNDGFKVSWDAVTDTSYGPNGELSVYYRLELSKDQGTTWQEFSRRDTSTTEETIPSLLPGVGYKVRIQAYSSSILYGNWVEGGETWTLSLPQQVGDLVVSDPNYDETAHRGGFKVSWTAPSDTGKSSDGSSASITGYEVAYAEVVKDTPGEYTPMTHGESTPEHVFTDLKTNTQYTIRIRVQTAAGLGPAKHVSGWTPSLPGAVDPVSIQLSQPTSSAIQITWDAPQPGRAGGSSSNNAATLYKVEVAPQDGSYVLVQDNYSSTIIRATNLSNSTLYRAQVTAKNTWGEAGVSESTNTVSTVALEPTPPSAVEDLKVVSLTANQVVLSWSEPTNKGTDGTAAADLTSYVVKYTETVKSNFIEIDERSERVYLASSLTATSTNATVVGLDGSTAYTFLVVAVNSGNAVGLDTEAPRVELTTAVAPPENFRNTLTCAKTDSVELAWDASSGATSYNLYRDGAPIGSTTDTTYIDTGLTAGTNYTYKVQACKDTDCSGDSTPQTITTLSDKSFKSIIDSKSIPTNLTNYDLMSREIFSLYNSGASIVAKYVKKGGSGDGDSFEDASGNLKTILNGITDASATKVYVVFLAGGTYTPETMSMKNHVAIVGGVNECLDVSDTATTLDGESTRRVFFNSGLDKTALLYGVRVINGNAKNENEDPIGPDGGGMYNYSSSPSLIGVTFSRNRAAQDGGGMYNNSSSPSLTRVVFSGNTTDRGGGGMYNSSSSPNLVGVTFSGNTAISSGGGMYNSSSSPVLVGVTLSENRAVSQGGGMYNNNNGAKGPTIVNSIFWENHSSSQIYFLNNDTGQENLRIYNSIVAGGTSNLINGETNTSVNHGGFASSGGSAPVVISFANITDADPKLDALTDNGGFIETRAIPSGSPAVNQGLYVKRKGTDYYYSTSGKVDEWYKSNLDLSGTPLTPPEGAEDLTATDATGHPRAGRPDLGAYEYR